MSEDFYVVPEMSRKKGDMAFVCVGCKSPDALRRAQSGDFSVQIGQLQSQDAKKIAAAYASEELGIQKPRFTTGGTEMFPLNKDNKNVSELQKARTAASKEDMRIVRYVILLEMQESKM